MASSPEFYSSIGQRFRERVSPDQWSDLTNFEGNAQGFRILNRDRYQGLKITYATLAAFTKYPRQSSIKNKDPERRSQKKFGFFQSEKEIFNTIAQGVGLLPFGDYTWSRHPLAFLVEAADDICYQLIDLEDGCRLGLVSYEDTVSLYASIIKDKFNREKLERIDDVNERIGVLRALAIGTLIEECSNLFLDNEENLLNGSFDLALTDAIPSSAVLSKIEKISIAKIYRSQKVMETEAAGFRVLSGLLDAFTSACYEKVILGNNTASSKAIFRLLPQDISNGVENSKSDLYEALLLCNDLISGMTDRHALSLFRKITGASLPHG